MKSPTCVISQICATPGISRFKRRSYGYWEITSLPLLRGNISGVSDTRSGGLARRLECGDFTTGGSDQVRLKPIRDDLSANDARVRCIKKGGFDANWEQSRFHPVTREELHFLTWLQRTPYATRGRIGFGLFVVLLTATSPASPETLTEKPIPYAGPTCVGCTMGPLLSPR